MKLGVLTVLLNEMSYDEAFAYLHSLGVETVELGTGGWTNPCHCNPEILLNDEAELEALKASLARHELTISALSCHGNAVHPNKDIAESDHRAFEMTCRLAQKLGVKTIVTFSGCPGDSPESKHINWVLPGGATEVLDYQWNEVIIPYWKKAVEYAKSYGVERIALELHPGFCVYNPATLLKLREAIGPIIGANFDPSHLIWQGMDPSMALRELKGAVYHFHAKDTKLYDANIAKNGVLNLTNDPADKSWQFRTIGYGTGTEAWRDIVSTLRLIGYDGAISIEHEDLLMSVREGLEKAVSFMKDIIIAEQPREQWWV